MPDEKLKANPRGTSIRASTGREKVGDFIRGAYDSISEQPLAKITDMLGLSNLGGMTESMNDPNQVMGAMPAPPGAGLGAKLGKRIGAAQALAPERAAVASSRPGMPPEFQQMHDPQFAPSKHSVSMDQLPSGKMEYLDPDVSAIMGDNPMDFAGKKAQGWLRAITGR